MKKTTKLLSVILAFVMALSCMTMMASAAKTSYQTVADLDKLNAYSPNGTVTRLTTEARLSILFDSLDPLLASLNIYMNVPVVNIELDLRSINGLCSTVDAVEGLLGNFIMKGLAGLALGIVGDINVDTWDQKGMTRENKPQLTIAAEILELLSNNTKLINNLFNEGVNLGLASSALGDMSAINNLLKDVPGAIKGLVFSLMSRQDDKQADRDKLSNKGNDLVAVAQDFVNGLFTKPMNWTSYRVDAAGNSVGSTLDLPTTPEDTTRYFVISDDKTKITQYDYNYAGLLGDPQAGFKETVTYTKSETEETAGSGVYLYVAPASYSGDRTLKWYKAGDPSQIDDANPDKVVDANGRIQSSYWLPSVAKAFKDKTLSLELNGDNDTVRGLVYKFAPYLFREMAVTVLNGSAKKKMAEAFDVKFTKIGLQNEQAVKDVSAATGNPDNFFTKEQDYYVWEYSDYKIIDGVPYYRYQDQYFKGEIPNNISAYYYMFNWDWNIPANFMDEFIPTSDGNAWALDNLNSLIKKAIDTMILAKWTVKGKEYKRAEVFPWATANGNGDLLNNLMVCARNFFKIAPEEIVDEYYADAQFYKPMMEGTLPQAVNGLVCELVKLIMPQVKFPDNIIDEPITAIAAVVVRELCTQLMPTYNFDAMIYANYGDASNKVRTLATHEADEWLNIALYMGVNLGMYYLRNIADIGEDVDLGYYSVMSDLKAIPTVSNRNTTAAGDAMTFTATSYKLADGTPSWLVAVDWIVDWALATNVQWAWKFGNLVECGQTVDLASYQNPFNKLDRVLVDLIPFDQIFNVSNTKFTGNDYGSGTFLEKVLKDGIVDSIVNLDLPSLLGLLKIPDGSALRSTKIADNLVILVVDLIDSIFYKVAGNVDLIAKGTVNSVSALLKQENIVKVVVDLVGKLKTAYDRGLLDTLLPILNFFIGWTTDPQKFAEPEIRFSNDSGRDYFYTGSKETVTVRNASSGMLLRHYDDNAETPEADTAYTITLNNITSDDGSITVTAKDSIGPGESKVYDVTTSDTSDRAVITTLSYSFIGKDGNALGGEQKARAMTYVSAKAPSSSPVAESGEYKYSSWGRTYVNFVRNAYDKVQFVDSASAIENFGIGFTNKVDYATWVITAKEVTAAAAPLELDTTSYVHGNNENIPLKDEGIGHMPNQAQMAVCFDNVLDEKALVSGSSYYGGKVSLSIGNAKKDTDSRKGVDNLDLPTFYFYDGKEFNNVKSTVNANINVVQENYNTSAAGFDAAWATYKAARDAAAKIGFQPMQTATFATEYSLDNLKKVAKDLENARKALDENYLADAGVDISKVQSTLDGIEQNPNGDLNYQDYRLFEYFQYEKQRTGARNMIKSVTPPAAPESHIDSVWGNDLVNAIIEAQTGNVKTGVTATREDPTADDMANWERAKNEYRPASLTILDIEEQSAMLTYYANFMKAKPKTTDLTFLNKEIAYAEAQNYDSALYSADSWARYEKALADAKAITAASLQSDAFNAKYELMVAQNKLQLKERSMKEVGYMNEELIPLIQHADAIIANYDSGLYTVKAGTTVEDAFAQLVKALGVKYDVTVDGTKHEGILYDYSALTFQEYDRTATAKNKRAVDGAADKLRAAIENFECTAKVESKDATTAVDQKVRFIQGIVPNSLANVDALKAKLNVTSNVTPVYTASKAGQYGTGARVDLKASEAADAALYATYFVVIYGDVNGDGAVDALDVLEVDYANHSAYYMGDVYDDAADIDGNGLVNSDDYSAIRDSVYCVTPINQNPTH